MHKRAHNEGVINARDKTGAGETDLMLMAHVARKYYHGGQSKSEIADQLYLSRFKVARLLDAARDRGIVTFDIGLPGSINLGLSDELRSAYRLRRAIVIDDADLADDELFARLGAATTTLLAETLQEGDVVGMASTRTMMGLQEASVALPRVTFVQITGALPRSDAHDVINGIRHLTRMAAGRAQVFYAPMVASDSEARNSYLAQPETQAAFALHGNLSVFITGVGDWSEGLSLTHDALTLDLQAEARARGAVAEVAGVPIDAAGRTVQGGARDRIIAPDIERLTGTRERMAVTFDPRRAPAVRVAMASGVINALVTHRAQAEALLAL